MLLGINGPRVEAARTDSVEEKRVAWARECPAHPPFIQVLVVREILSNFYIMLIFYKLASVFFYINVLADSELVVNSMIRFIIKLPNALKSSKAQ